jgi:hypothetical protein
MICHPQRPAKAGQELYDSGDDDALDRNAYAAGNVVVWSAALLVPNFRTVSEG